jgi:hypothetical protein
MRFPKSTREVATTGRKAQIICREICSFATYAKKGMSPGDVLRSAEREQGTSAEVGYRSPWYTGHERSHAPEPGPYRHWREARSDWVTTQRPEDFQRMLAAVTPGWPEQARGPAGTRLDAKPPPGV